MILVVLIIGTIILVSALRGTYGALFSDLGQDVPKFIVWGAAILALGALGFIPGLRPISRGLMALVLIVIVMQNYANILAGFSAVAKAPTASSTPPAANTNTSSATVPNYSQLDEMTPGSAFTTSAIGQS